MATGEETETLPVDDDKDSTAKALEKRGRRGTGGKDDFRMAGENCDSRGGKAVEKQRLMFGLEYLLEYFS